VDTPKYEYGCTLVDIDRLNRWLTLGANVGVLLGIAFLIVELNQTNEMNRGETRNQIASELSELLRDVSNNPQLAELIVRAENGEELTPRENMQYTQRILSMLRYFENVHYQFRQGLYDESEFSTQKEAWRKVYAGSKTTVGIWCEYRMTFSPEFRGEFDNLLDQFQCR
jgi:hypothetical protein